MVSGLLFILMAGTFSGTFAVPFKANKGWAWENNWLTWSVVALLAAPWIVGAVTIPHLFGALSGEMGPLALVALFGLVWGVGAVLFGKGIDLLGISLGLPIMQGLINAVGTLMPIVIKDPAGLITLAGLKIIAGVVIIVVGIILYASAGARKERELAAQAATAGKPQRNFRKGLLVCILSGVFGPMINFAFVFGAPLQQRAIELGAEPVYAANAIWCVVLTAGFIVNAMVCIRLLSKNTTWANFRLRRPHGLAFASLAGVLWYLSIMFYGMGGNSLGEMGASVGWATMQSTAVVAGAIAGLTGGEWKGSSKRSHIVMFAGLALIVVGIIVIAF